MNTILQWNLNSYQRKFCEIKLLASRHAPACMCLQETLITSARIYPPSGYNAVHRQSDPTVNHDRGVAILINKNFHHEHLNLNTRLQAVAVKIYMNKPYTICSIYLPHEPTNKQELENLLTQLPTPFLILGDMNAHSPTWGSNHQNDRGKIISDLILENDICLLNDDTPTHFHIQNGTLSIIDLAIASSNCHQDFQFSVLSDLHGSDHYPILITSRTPSVSYDRPARFIIDKADWNKFNSLTTMEPYNEDDNQPVDIYVNQITETLISAANQSIPITSGRRPKPTVPWWTPECRRAVKERNLAARALRNNHNENNLIRFRRARAKCQYTLNTTRRKSWEQYVSNLKTGVKPKEIWKRVNKIRGKYCITPPPVLHVNNRLVTDPQETSTILAESFASNERYYSQDFLRYKDAQENRPIVFPCNQQQSYNTALTKHEFKHCLALTRETSPGLDKITYSLIKAAHHSLQDNLLHIFNRIFTEEQFPSSWKTAIVIPFPKPNKDSTLPENYRPISLTSCLCKLLEKIINIRLMWYLEINNLISKKQSGFRKNRSTTDHLVQLSDDIQSAIHRREHTIVVFFDVNKAYDTAWRHGILKYLHEYGLRGHLPNFIKNFLQDRKITVRIGNIMSPPVVTSIGVPQGSVLSCTCFLIAINKISEFLPPSVNATLFVDDYAIYASGRLPHLIERKLQTAINNLSRWSATTGFTMNKIKTISVHICRKRNCPKTANNLILDGMPIKNEPQYKFLGLYFDESLSWKYHITQLKRKCIKTMNIIKLLSNTKWGSDQKVLLRLYIMLIKPRLDYGIEAYFPAAESYLKSLHTVQNSAIRLSTGAFKSSPIVSLHALSGIKPIETYNNIKLINFYLRLLVNTNHPLHQQAIELNNNQNANLSSKSFFSKIESIKQEFHLDFQHIMEEMTPEQLPWTINNLSSCTDLQGIKKKRFFNNQLNAIYRDHFTKHEHENYIFTDGSKTQEGTSFSIISPNNSRTFRLQNSASIFTAELSAILKTVRTIDNEDNRNVTIATDSKSSIQSITRYIHQNPLVQEIQQAIADINKNICLCWVPSHVGIRLNEQADNAARHAIENLPPTPTNLPRNDHKCNSRQSIIRKWKNKWENIRDNKLHNIQPTLTTLPYNKNNRNWTSKLNRLKIGHTRLTHGHLMARRERDFCEDCLVPLTVPHIIIVSHLRG